MTLKEQNDALSGRIAALEQQLAATQAERDQAQAFARVAETNELLYGRRLIPFLERELMQRDAEIRMLRAQAEGEGGAGVVALPSEAELNAQANGQGATG